MPCFRKMASRALLVSVCLCVIAVSHMMWPAHGQEAGAVQIDADIYAKLFEVNRPAWTFLAELVQEKLKEGSKVLDVGAGPGEPTATMAQRLPKHFFVLTDHQEAMLEKARVRAGELR